MKAREINDTFYMLHMWPFSVYMSPSFLVFIIIHTDLSRMMKYHHKKMRGQVWLVIISRLLPYVCSDDQDEPLPPAHF